MQLGSRWQAGHAPHPGVPEQLHGAIAASELGQTSKLSGGGSWTLTWLEGRPRVELIDASGELLADLSVSADGRVTERPMTGAAGEAAGGASRTDETHRADDDDDDDDDDDWLS